MPRHALGTRFSNFRIRFLDSQRRFPIPNAFILFASLFFFFLDRENMTINANAHKHRHTQWRLGGSVRANSVLYACYNIVANGRQKRKERKKDVPFIQLLLELMYCLHLALPLSLCVTTSMASPSFCKPTRHRKSPCIWFLAKRKKRRFCIKKSE